MEDYEVRDMLRRATTPDLEAELSLNIGMLRFPHGNEFSEPFFLECTVRNHAAQPAHYALLDLFVDYDLANPFAIDPFIRTATVDDPPRPKCRVFRRTIAAPPGVPIFKEGIDPTHVASIALQVPARIVGFNQFYIETDIKAPGFSKREEWRISSKGGVLKIYRPNP
jgi:hypothetical protein